MGTLSKTCKKLLLASLFVSTAHLGPFAHANNTTATQTHSHSNEIQKKLDHFKANPLEFMMMHPEKRDAEGQLIKSTVIEDYTNAVLAQKSISNRDQIRQKIMNNRLGYTDETTSNTVNRLPIGAVINGNDRSENLVDNSNNMLVTLEDIERHNLTSASLSATPWSDSYWPIYRGVLGARYSNPYFPTSARLQDYIQFVSTYPLTSYVFDQNQINTLSPSEKYDLLVNDLKGGLTNSMWNSARTHVDAYGNVATWMGICHGWAAASYMLPRPQRAVSIPKAYRDHNGRDYYVQLQFYPSDIKALASYLWSKSAERTRFIGGRCNIQRPQTDQYGRIQDSNCFDTNPGTWHLSVVNQIGVSRRSFIIDATYDHEVWNQPVYSYAYSYFNPQTLKVARNLNDAKVSVRHFTNDRFSRYRSTMARSVVGVSMTVTYMLENGPFATLYDGPQNDMVRSVTYQYDLELDNQDRIIGGEWYTNAHPDFLWTPGPRDRAQSNYDSQIRSRWNGTSEPPADIVSAAQAASRQGDVLANIVEGLIRAAQ